MQTVHKVGLEETEISEIGTVAERVAYGDSSYNNNAV